jgi:pimeloyl-ACP methyl ester carboxylesterase
MIYRKYAVLQNDSAPDGAWQIHYREKGEGAPVVMLHPSPLSSNFMQPLMSLFSKQSRTIAMDTPGYGQSDPLPVQGEGLANYVAAVHDFIVALGLEKPVIYGSATGAQIAIDYGKAYPDETRGLLLDNASWLYDSEREEIMKSYFPDISPQADGSHFQLVWKMVTQLYNYFPWYDTSEAGKVNDLKMPVAMLHQTALEYFNAGSDYDLAYRAAFWNEDDEKLKGLKIPTRIIRWQDSLIKEYADRLDNAELPDNIEMRFCDSGVEVRYAGLESALKELLGQ